jgi:hypothetical protein
MHSVDRCRLEHIGVGYDLTTFLVIGSVGDPPLNLFGRKRNFKFRKKLFHVSSGRRICAFGCGDAPSVGALSVFSGGLRKGQSLRSRPLIAVVNVCVIVEVVYLRGARANVSLPFG